ncbi:MAG: hypothetical protein ACKO23_16635 [Gemmataceae bacterium]
MTSRRPVCLTPYRLPTDNSIYLGDDEIACILNGFLALWHPSVLRHASALPRLAYPHEFEDPAEDGFFAFPENPSLMLPEDWRERTRARGSVVFTALADPKETGASLREQLENAAKEAASPEASIDFPEEIVDGLRGIGFGCLILEALFEAMSHQNGIPHEAILQDIHEAIEGFDRLGIEHCREHMQKAADRLLSARETLYPVNLYLIDLHMPDGATDERPWRSALETGCPANVLALGGQIEELAANHPECLNRLASLCQSGKVDIVGGPYQERDDPLLPLESQIWNIREGQRKYAERLGREVQVFGRKRFGFYPQLPALLQAMGIPHCLLDSLDGSGSVPSHQGPVISWPSHDGKSVLALTRKGLASHSPSTFFHLAHHLHQAIMQDQTATLVLQHVEKPACDFYRDWLALTRLSPVLGNWVTLADFFKEVMPSEYASAESPDAIEMDFLSEPGVGEDSRPGQVISRFPAHYRQRRQLDACFTFQAMVQAMGGQVAPIKQTSFLNRLQSLENQVEEGKEVEPASLSQTLEHCCEALARRILPRSSDSGPGFLVLNPCGFARRLGLEIPLASGAVPVGGSVKAFQARDGIGKVVVEVPPFGFASVPVVESGEGRTREKMKLAEERIVRNEFFEAEIDPNTGGIRELRDMKTRRGRLAQQLVFNPGGATRVRSIQITDSGPAMGEVTSDGVLVDDSSREVARFRQRFRAWLGRPVLDIRVELELLVPLDGYPWHSFLGSRFAWRDENISLWRGSCGLRSSTSLIRPISPDFIEWRGSRYNTVLFPGGLPFHQRHGNRMLDVLLMTEGEKEKVFDLAVGLDREQPMQTALGLVSPAPVLPVKGGLPLSHPSSWLFHLDASNVMVTSLRSIDESSPSIRAVLQECSGHFGMGQFRCFRNPHHAEIQDLKGQTQSVLQVEGDAINLEINAHDLASLRIDFS